MSLSRSRNGSSEEGVGLPCFDKLPSFLSHPDEQTASWQASCSDG